MIQVCERQVIAGFSGIHGWNMAAVMQIAEAMGALSPMLVDLLPEIENIILWAQPRDEK